MPSKDHESVVEFLDLFGQLRTQVHNDPSDLEEKAAKNDSLRRLCLDVLTASEPFEFSESRARRRFVRPVNPVFIEAWRAFEADYHGPLGRIWLAESGLDLDKLFEGSERIERSATDDQGYLAEEKKQSQGIGTVFEIISEQLDHPEGRFPEALADELTTGIQAWEKLTREYGLDVEGIFR
jgi:hypothetical protein